MAITTISSREFNQHVNTAKAASKRGPVVITDRGKPAHVLLSYEEYKRLRGGRQNIADLLAMPGVEDVKFEPRRSREVLPAADLS